MLGVGCWPFAVALLVAANLFYLGQQFTAIRPLPYIVGEEWRDQFLSRKVGSYPAIALVNETCRAMPLSMFCI